MTKKINLTFRRQDFEEIYFRDGMDNIFNGPSTSKPLKTLLIMILLYAITFLISYYLENLEFVLFASVFVMIFAFSYFNVVYNSWKWKKEVANFINREEKIETTELEITDLGISYKQDNNTSIHRWIAFKSAKFDSDVIWLFGDNNHIFPRKSMRLEDFTFLKSEIAKNILEIDNRVNEIRK